MLSFGKKTVKEKIHNLLKCVENRCLSINNCAARSQETLHRNSPEEQMLFRLLSLVGALSLGAATTFLALVFTVLMRHVLMRHLTSLLDKDRIRV